MTSDLPGAIIQEIEWELGEDLYASALVDPALPVRMTFRFFPKERVSEATDNGRIGDLSTENDIVRIASNPSLEDEPDPSLTFFATLVPGRATQNSYDFSLVFFDQANKDAYDSGTPLNELKFLSAVPFKDTFTSRFVILDDRLSISCFE